jgi:AcrR family transcriptional regulator
MVSLDLAGSRVAWNTGGEMSAPGTSKRVRADAERSTARILEAAQTVLAVDPGASLERIADAAGLARATVHRRFSSRKALHDALVEHVNDRYLQAMTQARVATAPPLVALHRLAELVFELKVSHRFVVELSSDGCGPLLSGAVGEGIDLLCDRLRDAGAITAEDPAWCRQLLLSVLHGIDQLPPDSPALGAPDTGAVAAARADLLATTVIRALGGTA